MKPKILIADDDIVIIDLIMEILGNNYEYFSAQNGNEAYKIANDKLPDIILIDWNMPELSGIETIKLLKKNERTSDIPIIMITGLIISPEEFKHVFEAGAIDFIKKPIHAVELIARTRSMLMLTNYYKQTIKNKEWELAIQAKNILRNNEYLTNLIGDLEAIMLDIKEEKGDAEEKLVKILSELNHNTKTQAWEQFLSYFKSVHPQFITNLLTKYPMLTNNEIKLCVFLRLNLNSKEIATITVQNSESVDIARYRLRKKLKLQRKDNLNAFLMAI
ncbi:MAG: response regulator [Chlorobi bacterium]|nr:response regulator [Chlorobiota bacterium]